MVGMTMSTTAEFTIDPKAAPMMTPTARSMTLPLIANSRNSFSMTPRVFNPRVAWSFDPDVRCNAADRDANGGDGPLARSVDQARMHHGVPDHLPGWLSDRHQRQPPLLLDPSEQLEAVLGTGQTRLFENRIVERH